MTRREWKIAATGLAIGVLLAIAVQALNSWLSIDRCLDSGGLWNYQSDDCEVSLRP
jgi:hypothetical protein